ncbi:site-specific integrase [Streptomyces sp. NPDC046876]|uniref:site-specific integrase n=1 Tax=Streptomyces sp. NPDC046876 TaxID=3155616 RepID=UPI0033E24E8E
MLETGGSARDLVGFVLPESGGLARSTDPAWPYVLLDAAGVVVEPVERFFAELQACGRPPATMRSYGMDLLRWWRFLAGWGLEWDRVTRADARDFARWMQVAPKPVRVHWRRRSQDASTPPPARPLVGLPNTVTGRAAPGAMYPARTRVHSEAVLRSFYAFHLDEGTGPIINPFPEGRDRRWPPGAGRAFRAPGGGRYRPSVPTRLPRRIPDHRFNELFAALK